MKSKLLKHRGKLAVAVVAVFAITPASASAFGYEDYLHPGNVYPQGSFATASAHSQITGVDIYNSNHTVCAALASGYSGYTGSPFSGGHTTYIKNGDLNACTPGEVYWGPNPSSTYLHGAAYNPNQVTFDYVIQATYYWN